MDKRKKGGGGGVKKFSSKKSSAGYQVCEGTKCLVESSLAPLQSLALGVRQWDGGSPRVGSPAVNWIGQGLGNWRRVGEEVSSVPLLPEPPRPLCPSLLAQGWVHEDKEALGGNAAWSFR